MVEQWRTVVREYQYERVVHAAAIKRDCSVRSLPLAPAIRATSVEC